MIRDVYNSKEKSENANTFKLESKGMRNKKISNVTVAEHLCEKSSISKASSPKSRKIMSPRKFSAFREMSNSDVRVQTILSSVESDNSSLSDSSEDGDIIRRMKDVLHTKNINRGDVDKISNKSKLHIHKDNTERRIMSTKLVEKNEELIQADSLVIPTIPVRWDYEKKLRKNAPIIFD